MGPLLKLCDFFNSYFDFFAKFELENIYNLVLSDECHGRVFH